MRWVRRAILVLALLAVGYALARSYQPRPLGVDTALVTRGAVVVTIEDEGRTRVKSRFVVTAPLTGRMARVALEAGDEVEVGQVLLSIEAVDAPLLDARSRLQLEAEVRAAEAARDEAGARTERTQAALDQAVWDLRQAERLAQGGILPPDEVKARDTRMRTAEKELEAARFAAQVAAHRLEQAQAALAAPTGYAAAAGSVLAVTSPVRGVVLRVIREDAGFVAAGTPVLEIGDPRDLEVVVDLLSADAVRVRLGAPVELTRWGGPAPLTGTVRRVEPRAFTKVSTLGIEEQRVNVLVDLAPSAVGAASALGDGFSVEARVAVERADGVLKLPIGALFREGEGWAVFVAEDGALARLRRVVLGLRNEREAEVRIGLAEGDEVVLHPPDALADGALIERRR